MAVHPFQQGVVNGLLFLRLAGGGLGLLLLLGCIAHVDRDAFGHRPVGNVLPGELKAVLLVELAVADRGEMGHFGGRMPEGDDPWG